MTFTKLYSLDEVIQSCGKCIICLVATKIELERDDNNTRTTERKQMKIRYVSNKSKGSDKTNEITVNSNVKTYKKGQAKNYRVFK